MKHLIPILFLAVLLPLSAGAQSKAETAQYGKIVKKPAVKAADKFLAKFPQSVYAPKVLRIRDSLLFYSLKPDDDAGVLAFVEAHPESPFRDEADARILVHNTSEMSREEARRAAGDCLDAVGWRRNNIDYILALDPDLSLRILEADGTLFAGRTLPSYTLQDLPFTALEGPIEMVAPLGRRHYLHFAYRNGDSEYVEALYNPDEDILYQALFYGRALGEGRIEGQSPEAMEGLQLTPEVMWLRGRLLSNPALVLLSKADYLTDASFSWWQERNPKALSASPVKLAFGKLDPESSLVQAFKSVSKEKGKSYNVAKLVLRDHLAVVAQSKSSGEHLLLWCEPVVKGKQLRSHYFENDGTTLDLVFYQGKTTFKLKISLATQVMNRFK